MRGVLGSGRGTVLLPFLFVLPMLVLLAGWLEDMARVMDARGKAIAASDAASLAGALEAECVPRLEVRELRDESGGPAGLEVEVAGYDVRLDEARAQAAASAVAFRNPAPAGGSWSWEPGAGRKAAEDRYAWRTEGSVGLPWWGAAKLLLGAGRGHATMPVSYESEARAVCIPGGSGG